MHLLLFALILLALRRTEAKWIREAPQKVFRNVRVTLLRDVVRGDNQRQGGAGCHGGFSKDRRWHNGEYHGHDSLPIRHFFCGGKCSEQGAALNFAVSSDDLIWI